MSVVTQISTVSTPRHLHCGPSPAPSTTQVFPSADGRPAVTTVSSPAAAPSPPR